MLDKEKKEQYSGVIRPHTILCFSKSWSLEKSYEPKMGSNTSVSYIPMSQKLKSCYQPKANKRLCQKLITLPKGHHHITLHSLINIKIKWYASHRETNIIRCNRAE